METTCDTEPVTNSVDVEDSLHNYQNIEIHSEESRNDWVPECEEGKKPYIEQVFPDLDAAYEYYKEYGRLCGFDIRRSQQKSDRKGNIILKYFVCSRAGTNETQNSKFGLRIDANRQRIRKTVSAKCMCPAMLSVGAAGEKGFSVQKFIQTHNHSFASKDGIQFLRCNRTLSDFHKRFIVDAAKLNIGATRAHGIFKAMCGSYENVGATEIDFKNFSRDIKQYIGKHDADMIIQKFKDIRAISDDSFKFEYETDSNNHLTRLIWADGIGRRNYDVFGEVVSFDATYRTNKYNMVFIPLIGIDNHWKSVTFAGSLLESESSENFKWLCEAFKKIFGRLPRCVITDQCPAMKVAIETCFPGVKHRLCMWHIMKKFPAKLGSLFCAESSFMDSLNNFVWCDHVSPVAFENGWNEIVAEFGLSDNKWLQEMFEIRKSWIPAYFNDEPMIGLLRTTSRSESSNFYFNHFVQRGDTLSEFYLCYDTAIQKQRQTSKKLIHYDDIMPRTITQKNIERDAAEMYTRTMFYRIQDEILASGGDMYSEDNTVLDGAKIMQIKDPMNLSTTFKVSLNLETLDLECSCKLFMRVGYLCRHAFFCLANNGIHKIPRQYVTNRWLKKAVERFSTLQLGEISDPMSNEDKKRDKIKDCWFMFQGCVSDASVNLEHIDFLLDGMQAIRKKIKMSAKRGNIRLDDETIEELIGSKIVEEISILPPNQSSNKGCRKRLVNPAEKSLGGKKRAMRECKSCKQLAYHDSRNCPNKNLGK